MTTEVFAHLRGRNLRFFVKGIWQDPARNLTDVFTTFTFSFKLGKTAGSGSLLGDFCQSVFEGVNDEFEPVGDLQF